VVRRLSLNGVFRQARTPLTSARLRPVRVIAAGRASEIVDLGSGRVLRRFKGGGRPAREAEIMEHARAYGFPVPQVLEVLEDALVLEGIDGPTMLADLRRRQSHPPRLGLLPGHASATSWT